LCDIQLQHISLCKGSSLMTPIVNRCVKILVFWIFDAVNSGDTLESLSIDAESGAENVAGRIE
jgi:hypothetical protein